MFVFGVVVLKRSRSHDDVATAGRDYATKTPRWLPVTFPQDTSGRVVVYDLLSGSMLGVLALKDDAITSVPADRPNRSGEGAAVSHESGVPKADILWSEGGECIAAVIPQEQVRWCCVAEGISLYPEKHQPVAMPPRRYAR